MTAAPTPKDYEKVNPHTGPALFLIFSSSQLPSFPWQPRNIKW